jgi:hypothetical protein
MEWETIRDTVLLQLDALKNELKEKRKTEHDEFQTNVRRVFEVSDVDISDAEKFDWEGDNDILPLSFRGRKLMIKRSFLTKPRFRWNRFSCLFEKKWDQYHVRDKDGSIYLDFRYEGFSTLIDQMMSGAEVMLLYLNLPIDSSLRFFGLDQLFGFNVHCSEIAFSGLEDSNLLLVNDPDGWSYVTELIAELDEDHVYMYNFLLLRSVDNETNCSEIKVPGSQSTDQKKEEEEEDLRFKTLLILAKVEDDETLYAILTNLFHNPANQNEKHTFICPVPEKYYEEFALDGCWYKSFPENQVNEIQIIKTEENGEKGNVKETGNDEKRAEKVEERFGDEIRSMKNLSDLFPLRLQELRESRINNRHRVTPDFEIDLQLNGRFIRKKYSLRSSGLSSPCRFSRIEIFEIQRSYRKDKQFKSAKNPQNIEPSLEHPFLSDPRGRNPVQILTTISRFIDNTAKDYQRKEEDTKWRLRLQEEEIKFMTDYFYSQWCEKDLELTNEDGLGRKHSDCFPILEQIYQKKMNPTSPTPIIYFSVEGEIISILRSTLLKLIPNSPLAIKVSGRWTMQSDETDENENLIIKNCSKEVFDLLISALQYNSMKNEKERKVLFLPSSRKEELVEAMDYFLIQCFDSCYLLND